MEREPLGDVTNRKIESPKEKLQKERNYGRKAINSIKNYIGRLNENFGYKINKFDPRILEIL